MAGANHRQRLRDLDNTGFGANSSIEGGRLVNPDGSNNLKKRGLPVWERTSVYHTLLRMKRSHFFFFVLIEMPDVQCVQFLLYYKHNHQMPDCHLHLILFYQNKFHR